MKPPKKQIHTLSSHTLSSRGSHYLLKNYSEVCIFTKAHGQRLLRNLIKHKSVATKEITVSAQQSTTIHNHCDSEIWEITAGSGILSDGKQEIWLKTGDIIKFSPFIYHIIRNNNAIQLRYQSYWYIDEEDVIDSVNLIGHQATVRNHRDSAIVDVSAKLIIGSAFATPNGPLHLGHIAGPYLAFYIMCNYYKLNNIASATYSGTFGHCNHIQHTAEKQHLDSNTLIESSEKSIINDLRLLDTNYNYFLLQSIYSQDESIKNLAQQLINTLITSGLLVEKTVLQPVDDHGCYLSESYVSGSCPCCGEETLAMECEHCGLFQDETKFLDPVHADTKNQLSTKLVTKLYLKITDKFVQKFMTTLFAHNDVVSHILAQTIKKYYEYGHISEVPISTFRNNGIYIYQDQVATIPFERALRAYLIINKHKLDSTGHLFFCGSDNLCASGLFMPYLISAYH